MNRAGNCSSIPRMGEVPPKSYPLGSEQASLFSTSSSSGTRLRFFFQAEDGIRDTSVTGVQTCALPIFTEVYMGMRPGEEKRTEQFLRSLEFYPVTWEIARTAGRLYNQWRLKGLTLALSDVKIGRASCRERVELLEGGGGARHRRDVCGG